MNSLRNKIKDKINKGQNTTTNTHTGYTGNCNLLGRASLPVSKQAACSAGDLGSIPGSGRFPWRRKWQPTPFQPPVEGVTCCTFPPDSRPWNSSQVTEQTFLFMTLPLTDLRMTVVRKVPC